MSGLRVVQDRKHEPRSADTSISYGKGLSGIVAVTPADLRNIDVGEAGVR